MRGTRQGDWTKGFTIFTLVLVFSTVVPLVLPFGALFFYIKYLFDKFNLIYVCPEQFESAGKISRNKPIVYSIIALVLYQITMAVVFIITNDYVKYIILIIASFLGLFWIIYVIQRENSKLNLIDGKKQKKVSIILNPKSKECKPYTYHTNVSFDDENQDEIIERVRNAYIHPWENNFHAPVFKKSNRKSSVRFLFDIDEEESSIKDKSDEDTRDKSTHILHNEERKEYKSEIHIN